MSETSFNLPPVAGALSEEAAGFHGIAEYIECLNGCYTEVPIHQVASLMAVASEPIDRNTGRTDPEAVVASSFLPGSLVGMRAVEIAFGTEAVLDLHNGMAVKPPKLRGLPKEERITLLDRFAGSIQAVGEAGFEFAPNMHDLVSEWGDLTGDIHSIGYFRRGFGFVIYAAEGWHQRQLEQNLARLVVASSDQDLFDFFERQFTEPQV